MTSKLLEARRQLSSILASPETTIELSAQCSVLAMCGTENRPAKWLLDCLVEHREAWPANKLIGDPHSGIHCVFPFTHISEEGGLAALSVITLLIMTTDPHIGISLRHSQRPSRSVISSVSSTGRASYIHTQELCEESDDQRSRMGPQAIQLVTDRMRTRNRSAAGQSMAVNNKTGWLKHRHHGHK